ncbi:MAG: DNA-binding transcriptional regulator KdgR [Spirochaetales bacterium]
MVNSVLRAFAILTLLGKKGRMTLSQLCRELRIPKSTAFSILETLEKEQAVAREEETGMYSLGIRLLELGQEAQQNFELRRVASPVLQQLNREIDETVHLTVLDNDVVLYVDCYESSKRLRTYSVIGVRAPLYCTAVGKALLAFLDPDEQGRILQRMEFHPFTPHTITSKEALQKNLEEVRRRGYSVDDIEHEEGVRCVGAPIYNNKGRVCASLSISGPASRISSERIELFGQKALATAREISRRLGYRG